MSSSQPKILIIINILRILKEHSDEQHPLKQIDIIHYLENEYDIKADRKTVGRNLERLFNAEPPLPIAYVGEDDDFDIKSDTSSLNNHRKWYYKHKFLNGELRLLINSVLLTDGITKRHRIDFIRKIEQLASKHFHSEISKIDMNIYGLSENQEVILTLENLGCAIANKHQVSFHYCNYGIDKKLHCRKNNEGVDKLYTVNPYQIISRNGHQYLICNVSPYNDLTHFRIDRMKNVREVNQQARQLRTLKGFESGIRLSDYIKAHPNLWSGTAISITFQCHQTMMNEIIDSFGTDLQIQKLPDNMILVSVYASYTAMLHWAIQFADTVEVLTPTNLRIEIAQNLKKALKKYENK